jgi:hypothetical protein
MGEVRLRVVSGDARTLDPAAVRAVRPDIVVVQNGPWRLRWRTPLAHLASGCGVFFGGGGGPSAGNAVLVSLRVTVRDVVPLLFPLVPGRSQRGAVLARCTVGDVPFVVAGARLGDDPAERAEQSVILAKALAAHTEPVILAGELDPALLSSVVQADAAHPRPAQTWVLTAPPVRLEGFVGEHPVAADLTLAWA